MKRKIGFIPCRLQISSLHTGHKTLFDLVLDKCDKVYVLLGTCTPKLTKRNPLDFESRKQMVLSAYPDVEVYSIRDYHSDIVWSNKVDELISSLVNEEDDVTIYGSRDSFKKFYSGKYEAIELPEAEVEGANATCVREEIAKHPVDSEDFRKGVIYSAFNKYDQVNMTCDIAIIKENKEILLGRKPNETLVRFPGGFIDVKDISLEAAAKREAIEECGNIELADFTYISSQKVKDWRYKDMDSQIMTSFFTCKYIFGPVKASDDLEAVKWFDLDTVQESDLVEEHRPLLLKLKKYLNK